MSTPVNQLLDARLVKTRKYVIEANFSVSSEFELSALLDPKSREGKKAAFKEYARLRDLVQKGIETSDRSSGGIDQGREVDFDPISFVVFDDQDEEVGTVEF